jgi:hypothetical protein
MEETEGILPRNPAEALTRLLIKINDLESLLDIPLTSVKDEVARARANYALAMMHWEDRYRVLEYRAHILARQKKAEQK